VIDVVEILRRDGLVLFRIDPTFIVIEVDADPQPFSIGGTTNHAIVIAKQKLGHLLRLIGSVLPDANNTQTTYTKLISLHAWNI
jgi:hypothetical protein